MPAAGAEVDDAARCSRAGASRVIGRVAEAALNEISGVVASRRFEDVLWVHEDSGAPPLLTALSPTGATLGRYAVVGAAATDWEDIAALDGDLFIGDIGDNRGRRAAVTVYRVPEPEVRPDGRAGRLRPGATIHLRYPGGAADAEALLVDPVTEDLFILTKELLGGARILRAAAASLVDGATVTMEDVGTLDTPLVTGADIAADGRLVVVRTYAQVLAYERRPGQSVGAALLGRACSAPDTVERQGEAIGVTRDGLGYVTISEGSSPPVHQVAFAAARPVGWFASAVAASVAGAVAVTNRARTSS